MKLKLLYIVVILSFFKVNAFVCAQVKDQAKKLLKEKLLKLDSVAIMHYSNSDILYVDENIVKKLINISLEELDLLKAIDNDTLKLEFYERISYRFRMVQLYEISNKISLNSITIFENNKELATKKYNFINIRNIGQIAGNFLALNKKDSAFVYYKKAIDFADTHVGDKIMHASAYNNMGMFLSDIMCNYEDAIGYFNKAQKIMGTIKGPVFTMFDGSIRDNLGNAYVGNEEYNKAKNLYKINFYFFNPKLFKKPHRDYYRWIRAGIQVAEMNIKLNELNLANSRLDSLQRVLNASNDFNNKDKLILRLFKAKKNLATISNKGKTTIYYNRIKKFYAKAEANKNRKMYWKQTMNDIQKTKSILSLDAESSKSKVILREDSKALKSYYSTIFLILAISILIVIFVSRFIRN